MSKWCETVNHVELHNVLPSSSLMFVIFPNAFMIFQSFKQQEKFIEHWLQMFCCLENDCRSMHSCHFFFDLPYTRCATAFLILTDRKFHFLPSWLPVHCFVLIKLYQPIKICCLLWLPSFLYCLSWYFYISWIELKNLVSYVSFIDFSYSLR